ncbi:MAG: Ig-like domain-containing protein [Pelobium sp.]
MTRVEEKPSLTILDGHYLSSDWDILDFFSRSFKKLVKPFFLSLIVSFFLQNVNAQVCGTPGLDGPQNAEPPVNTYFPLSTTATLTSGSKTIVLNAVPPNDPNFNLSYGITPIKSGDLILIIQMQDATFDYTNSNLYGANSATSGPDGLGGTGYTNLNSSGKFEYVVAINDVPITGGTLTFRGAGVGSGCVNTYTNADAAGPSGQRRFQVVRVPQYSNLVLTSNITTPPYNGSVGGLIAFDVAGTMQFNGFIVDASERGFRGGYGPVSASNGNNSTDYVLTSTSTKSVGKGEGIGGTPRYMWDGFNQVNNGSDGLPGGSYGRGAPANGGGAGNDHNAGGGGGGNGGYGGVGGLGWEGHVGPNSYPNGGRPGSLLPIDYSRLIMGGGGGGGDANDATSGVKGGVGGGIVIINVEKIAGVGMIKANGGVGQAGAFLLNPDGAGGGGAGGSIFVRSLAASPTANLTLEVKGGNGGNTKNDNGSNTNTQPHGPGGGGGGGVIYTQLPFATISSVVTKGNSGISNNGAGIPHGAMNGTDGRYNSFITSDLPPHLQGGGSICYPVLKTTLTEQNPGAAGERVAGTTATYTLTIENQPTNGNAGNVEAWLNLPSSFKVSGISYVFTGAAAGTLDATPHIGATGIMNFGNFNISPGDKVTITIIVDIDGNAPTGVYHASAMATYLDPTRTNNSPSRKITASLDPFVGYNTTYESGGISDVAGSNYNGDLVASTAEDVYINALAVTGSCDAVTGGGFESYTPGDYSSIDKWFPVNSGDVVKIVDQTALRGAVIKNEGLEKFSLQQTIISIEPSTAYTLTFNYRNWDGCASLAPSKSNIEILDATTNAVIVAQTEFITSNSPAVGSVSFTTLSGTTSLVLKITDAGTTSPACGTFIDDISIVSNLNIVYDITNVTCNGADNGKATISLLTGAAAPYHISYSFNGGSYNTPTPINPINNSGTPLIFDNLIPGSYEVKIVDANGCENIEDFEFEVTEPDELALAASSKTDATCNGSSTGTVTAGVVTNSVGTVRYSWKNSSVTEVGTTSTVDNLPAGKYDLTVTDDCKSVANSVTVGEPALLNLAVSSKTDATCNGSSTGTVTAGVVTNSVGTVRYSWANSSVTEVGTTSTVNSLPAGKYDLTVTDDCKSVGNSVTVGEPALLTLSETHTNNVCFGDQIGKINVSVSGGTAPYTYQWNSGESTADLNDLGPGVYSLLVSDQNNCSQRISITITPLQPFVVTETIKQVKCFGENSGSIALNLIGGAAPYTITWGNGSTNSQLDQLTAGNYSFKAVDAYGCTIQKTISIIQPELLSASLQVKSPSCKYTPDGGIITLVKGGKAPYKFIWNDFKKTTTASLLNVIAGTYRLTIVDANNCSLQLSTEVFQGNCAPNAGDDSYITSEDKSITIQTPGVVVNDSDPDEDEIKIDLESVKDINGVKGSVSTNITSFNTANGTVIFNSLGSFTYIPNKDFFGTEHFIYQVNDGELMSNFATVTIVVTAINDRPIAVDDAYSTLEDQAVNGSVAINDSDADSDPLTFTLLIPPSSGNLTLNADGTFNFIPAQNFNGRITFTYQVCDPSGLCATAVATITVTPVNDPPVAEDDKFYTTPNTTITKTVITNDKDVDNDHLTFTKLTNPSHGTVVFYPSGTFTYTPVLGFKGKDTFTYNACDPSGLCDDATVTIIIQPVVTVNLTPTLKTMMEGETVSITAVLTESLVEDVEITLAFNGSAVDQSDYVLTGDYVTITILAGETATTQKFVVTALKDDVKEADEQVIANISSTDTPDFVLIGTGSMVTITDLYPVSLPTGPDENDDINPDPLVSPNGDGAGNESFIIYNISKYPDNEVVIFNRWGNEIYRIKGYNNQDRSFKGVANAGILTNTNKDLVDGVYYYLIYTTQANEKKLNKGYLILKR